MNYRTTEITEDNQIYYIIEKKVFFGLFWDDAKLRCVVLSAIDDDLKDTTYLCQGVKFKSKKLAETYLKLLNNVIDYKHHKITPTLRIDWNTFIVRGIEFIAISPNLSYDGKYRSYLGESITELKEVIDKFEN